MISCCSFFSCWKHTFASSSTSDPLPTGTVGLQQTTVAAAVGAERGSGESPPHRALREQSDCSHVGSGFNPDLVAVIEACKKSSQIREQRGDLQMDLKHRSEVRVWLRGVSSAGLPSIGLDSSGEWWHHVLALQKNQGKELFCKVWFLWVPGSGGPAMGGGTSEGPAGGSAGTVENRN